MQQQQQPQPRRRTTATKKRRIHLVVSKATLLSGDLNECHGPDDPTCHGGMAATAAFLRAYTQPTSPEKNDITTLDENQEAEDASLLVPFLDAQSPFVQMSPLGWSVNRLVWQSMLCLAPQSLAAFAAPPSLLLQNHGDTRSVSPRDISDLQSTSLPLVLSNVYVPPDNSWNPHHVPILFHAPTHLAVLTVVNDQQTYSTNQVSTVQTLLAYIAKRNAQNPNCPPTASNDNKNLFDQWVDDLEPLFAEYQKNNDTMADNDNNDQDSYHPPFCWIPILLYADVQSNLQTLLHDMLTNDLAPALIIDLEAHYPPLNQPRPLQDVVVGNQPNTTTKSTNTQTCWFLSMELDSSVYHHSILTVPDEPLDHDSSSSSPWPVLDHVQLIHHDLNVSLPPVSLEQQDNSDPIGTNTNTTTETTSVRDALYNTTLTALANLAQQAQIHDPLVARETAAMPVQRHGNYRRCKAGPCESASLYLDALQWYTQANVSFGNSGGYRGKGWPAAFDGSNSSSSSGIRISNLWDLLPFPNTVCTGVMTGVSLFRAFNYSIAMATFEGHNTDLGGLLLQVSGLRLTYNNQLHRGRGRRKGGPGNSTTLSTAASWQRTRLIQMEVWNKATQQFEPLQRLQLYKFATDSFMCTGHEQFRDFWSPAQLQFPGEVPGTLDPSAVLQQEIVADYLWTNYGSLNQTYQPTVQDRMINDTTATASQLWNFVQTPNSCDGSLEYWNAETFSCVSCPPQPTSGVVFLKESLELEGQVGGRNVVVVRPAVRSDDEFKAPATSTTISSTATISLVNTLSHNVTVISKSLPFWLNVSVSKQPTNTQQQPVSSIPDGSFTTSTFATTNATDAPGNRRNPRNHNEEDPSLSNSTGNVLMPDMAPGQEVTLDVQVDWTVLEPGTATGSAIFGFLLGTDEGSSSSESACVRPDAKFDLIVRVNHPENLNQLGNVRYFGWIGAAIIILTALCSIAWVVMNRQTRIVRTLQPLFLVTISVGVLVMGSALIPLGWDDEIASAEACGRACMAFPWLLSMGFTIAMSALFSKLWRINKLFQSAHDLRRIQVREKDVLGPFAVLFGLNFVALLLWTLLDPLQWERSEIDGRPSSHNQSYGACRSTHGPASTAMIVVVGVVNASAFCVACYQAFCARNVSDEFSESRSLGVALFSWVQLLLVGVPVLFLIDEDNPSARYFITAGLTFAFCMSMLLLIYVPIFIQKKKAERRAKEQAHPSSYCRPRILSHSSSEDSHSSGMASTTRLGSSGSLSSANTASHLRHNNPNSHHLPGSHRSIQFSINNVGSTRISGMAMDMKQYANDLLKRLPSLNEGSLSDDDSQQEEEDVDHSSNDRRPSEVFSSEGQYSKESTVTNHSHASSSENPNLYDGSGDDDTVDEYLPDSVLKI